MKEYNKVEREGGGNQGIMCIGDIGHYTHFLILASTPSYDLNDDDVWVSR